MMCESAVWNLLHVSLLVPRILRCLVNFWKICVPLAYATQKLSSVKVLNDFCIFFRNDYETGRQGNVARQRNMKRRKSAKG